MTKRQILLLTTVLLGAIALTILWLGFGIRYVWYLDANTAALYDFGLAACLLALLATWVFVPSRILAGAITLVALTFPIALGSVGINVEFIPFMLIMIAPPVAVAHLSRKLRAAQ